MIIVVDLCRHRVQIDTFEAVCPTLINWLTFQPGGCQRTLVQKKHCLCIKRQCKFFEKLFLFKTDAQDFNIF